MRHNFGEKLKHVYTDNEAFLAGRGYCVTCQTQHGIDTRPPTISLGGYPCQPFTYQRSHSGTTPRTSPNASSHPLYPVLMEGFPKYLRERRPRAFVVENVEALLNLDPKVGKSPCDELVQHASSLGYAVRVLKLDHDVFVLMSRPRIWIIGFSGEGGGERAADWTAKALGQANSFLRNNSTPQNPLDIVDMASFDEVYRQARVQDCRARPRSPSCAFARIFNSHCRPRPPPASWHGPSFRPRPILHPPSARQRCS